MGWAVAAPALITGALGTAGGIVASRSQNKATDAQSRAAREALAYQKEQDAKAEQQYREQQARLDAQWQAYQAQREPYRQLAAGVMSRYGITPSAASSVRPEGWTGQATASRSPNQYGMTLADLAGLTTPARTPRLVAPRPGLTLSEILRS